LFIQCSYKNTIIY